jgi:hypothetical protein
MFGVANTMAASEIHTANAYRRGGSLQAPEKDPRIVPIRHGAKTRKAHAVHRRDKIRRRGVSFINGNLFGYTNQKYASDHRDSYLRDEDIAANTLIESSCIGVVEVRNRQRGLHRVFTSQSGCFKEQFGKEVCHGSVEHGLCVCASGQLNVAERGRKQPCHRRPERISHDTRNCGA